ESLNAASMVDVRRLLFFIFGEAVFGRHMVTVQYYVERAAAHVQFVLRVRDFDVRLFEELPDAIIDVTPDLHITARAIRPDEQPKIERVIAEADELHIRFRVCDHVLDTFGSTQR